MHDINKLADKVEELRSEILGITETPEADVTDEQAERMDPALAEFAAAKADLAKAEARAAAVADVVATTVNRPAVKVEGAPEVIVKRDAFEALSTRYTNRKEQRQALIDGNLRALEGKIESREAEVHVEAMLKRHASDVDWASDLLQRSHPDYASGFFKVLSGRDFALDSEERTALSTLTNANGKYAVPVYLDPTVILTNSGTSNVIRPIARVVTQTVGNVWNGLSSDGITASFDTELSEVSDDSPTFAQPSITIYQAQAFAQYSIQAEQDIDGLGQELLVMFADAKDRLEAAKHANGSGSGEPFGIFPALVGGAQAITSAGAAAIALADLNSVYTTLPVRWRGKSTWVYNPQVGTAIKTLGTAISASFSGDLREPTAGRILGRPVVESDDAPFVSTTTVLDPRLVLGDFSNYVIVDKPGSMTVEAVPHMFHTSNNLPNGARGVYAHWRTGADSVNDKAFEMLTDKTSA